MEHTEQSTVILNLKMVQATRIRDEFGRIGDIARALERVINEALRKEAQATQEAPDDALIPVTVELTLQQARMILAKFKPCVGFPTDGAIYSLIKDAISKE